MVSCDKVVSSASFYGDGLQKPVSSRFFPFFSSTPCRKRRPSHPNLFSSCPGMRPGQARPVAGAGGAGQSGAGCPEHWMPNVPELCLHDFITGPVLVGGERVPVPGTTCCTVPMAAERRAGVLIGLSRSAARGLSAAYPRVGGQGMP